MTPKKADLLSFGLTSYETIFVAVILHESNNGCVLRKTRAPNMGLQEVVKKYACAKFANYFTTYSMLNMIPIRSTHVLSCYNYPHLPGRSNRGHLHIATMGGHLHIAVTGGWDPPED